MTVNVVMANDTPCCALSNALNVDEFMAKFIIDVRARYPNSTVVYRDSRYAGDNANGLAQDVHIHIEEVELHV